MRKNVCEKCCVGTVIYSDKCGKTAVGETVDAEINNIIYTELYSGAKMADSKYRKTYVAVSVDQENTVYYCHLPYVHIWHDQRTMFEFTYQTHIIG
jgi:hypothetical protein